MKVKVKAVIWWSGCEEYVKRYDERYFPVGSLCTYENGEFIGAEGAFQRKTGGVKFGAESSNGVLLFEEV